MKNALVIVVLTLLFACGSDEKKSALPYTYKVDDAMVAEIGRQLNAASTADSLNVRIIVDDSVTFSSYETARRLGISTTASLHQDTLHIQGFMGTAAGLGFSLDLYGDGADVKQIVKSVSTIYKLKENDPLLYQYLEVPCTRAEVVLARKPRFVPGEIISGKVQLSSVEYYEKLNGKTRKYKVQLTAYFKTEAVTEDK